MNNIVNGMLARMRFKGWTYQTLADALHKDVNTVKRQLSESKPGNLTLATIEEYLFVLGGRLVYETGEALDVINNSDVNELRTTINTIGSQNDELKRMLEDRDATIANLRQRNISLQEKLSTMIESNAKMASALCDISMKLSDKI